jgi:hypothetical protein
MYIQGVKIRKRPPPFMKKCVSFGGALGYLLATYTQLIQTILISGKLGG